MGGLKTQGEFVAQRVRFEWVVEAGMGLDRFERSQGLKNQMILRSQKKFLKAVFEREEGFFFKMAYV